METDESEKQQSENIKVNLGRNIVVHHGMAKSTTIRRPPVRFYKVYSVGACDLVWGKHVAKGENKGREVGARELVGRNQ